MKKKKEIELRPLTEIYNTEPVCICTEIMCLESIKPTHSEFKKAERLANNLNEICFGLIHVGSKTYVISESCSFLNRIILFNASKTDKNGIKVFVKSTLSSEMFFSETVAFEKGHIV